MRRADWLGVFASPLVVVVATLMGCQHGGSPLAVRPTWVLDRVAEAGTAPVGAPAEPSAGPAKGLTYEQQGRMPDLEPAADQPAVETPAGDAVDATAPAQRPSAARGSRADTSAASVEVPGEFWVGPDGGVMSAPDADVVALPRHVPGLWSYFAPGRVPSTIEVGGAPLAAIHPRPLSEPSAMAVTATITGVVAPPVAGAIVMYAGPSRRSDATMAVTAADGAFQLSVPAPGPEDGVVVVRAKAGAGLARVRLEPAAAAHVEVSLAAPVFGAVIPPEPPPGLMPAESAVLAVVETDRGPVRAPLWSADEAPFEPPVYALGAAALAVEFVALGANGTAGSAASRAPEDVLGLLPPPDLAALPPVLAPGVTLAWPSIAGATYYTVRLTATADGAPLWEAAVREPRVVVPTQLTAEPQSTLEVVAWDVPALTTYAIAGLRALRFQDEVPGVRGRRSWATRVYGRSGKS